MNRIKQGHINILNEMTEYIDAAIYYAVIIDCGDIWCEKAESMISPTIVPINICNGRSI